MRAQEVSVPGSQCEVQAPAAEQRREQGLASPLLGYDPRHAPSVRLVSDRQGPELSAAMGASLNKAIFLVRDG